MVNPYKITKNNILEALAIAAPNYSVSLDINNIIEIGSEDNSFAHPLPFVAVDFNFGSAYSHNGFLHILKTTIFIGVEAPNIGEAKVLANTLASEVLNTLFNHNLVQIPQNSIFKEFYKSYSNICIVKLSFQNTITSF